MFVDKENRALLNEMICAYRTAHHKLLADDDFQALRDRVLAIRKADVAGFDTLWQRGIQNLESQGVHVYRAADRIEAQKIVEQLTSPTDRIVRSKSNVIDELHLDTVRKVIPTDTGDWIVDALGREKSHPVYPAADVPLQEIRGLLARRGIAVDETSEAAVAAVVRLVRQEILQADVGLTGANFVTSEGHIVIVENEGNAALVSHHPRKHIVFAASNRITSTIEDAMTLVRGLCMFAMHRPSPAYINIITGPSCTDDVMQTRVFGVHGPSELHLVIVDNGRTALLEDKKVSTLLRCINCGACLQFCPAYAELGPKFGAQHIGGYGILMSHAMGGDLDAAFKCFGCEMCDTVCPVETEVFSSLRKLRLKLGSAVNEKIRTDILDHGNAVEGSDHWKVRT